MSTLNLAIATGDALDIRSFSVRLEMSACFTATLHALSENAEIDIDNALGQPACFTLPAGGGKLQFTGVCSAMSLERAEVSGLSEYCVTVVPTLWQLGLRRNFRVFQFLSEIEIVQKLLEDWAIPFETRLGEVYRKRKYRVQYGETDLAFVSRLMEDAGVSFFFEDNGLLVLSDKPEAGELRPSALRFFDAPSDRTPEFATRVRVEKRMRTGRYVIADHDYRRSPRYELRGGAAEGLPAEQRLETYHYIPGASLVDAPAGGDTPCSDDRGASRHDEAFAGELARKRLAAKRAEGQHVSFASDALDLVPGVVVRIHDHPNSELARPLLVLGATLSGTSGGLWRNEVQTITSQVHYAPPLRTPRPKTQGVECATVVGPEGEEIHCDEQGRVRVQFHWDREANFDEKSSCWIHVNQAWGGAGFGATHLPRVGQEVLVDFLGGDPDRPVVTGRVHTSLQPTPYALPLNKTVSGIRTASTGNTGGFNALGFDDQAGKELVLLRAERDYVSHVRNAATHLVGGERVQLIGATDGRSVGGDDLLQVGGHSQTDIADLASTTYRKGATVMAPDGPLLSHAKGVVRFESEAAIELRVGDNHIVIGTEGILIQGRVVELCPAEPPPPPAPAPLRPPLPAGESCTGGWTSRDRDRAKMKEYGDRLAFLDKSLSPSGLKAIVAPEPNRSGTRQLSDADTKKITAWIAAQGSK